MASPCRGLGHLVLLTIASAIVLSPTACELIAGIDDRIVADDGDAGDAKGGASAAAGADAGGTRAGGTGGSGAAGAALGSGGRLLVADGGAAGATSGPGGDGGPVRDGASGTGDVDGEGAGDGASASGGSSAAGGASSAGGSSPVGGATSTGGATPTGGASATGGTASTGGVSGSGGAPSSGGVSASGGASSSGGRGSGGLTGTGGANPPPCPGPGLTSPNVGWAVQEGDSSTTATVNLSASIGASASGDWSVSASGAPSWISVPSVPTTATAVVLKAPSGVPYDAFPGPSSFDVTLTWNQNAACTSTTAVALGVMNVLSTPVSYSSMPTGITAATWHAPTHSFYLLEGAAGRFYRLDTTSSPTLGQAISLPVVGTVARLAFAASTTSLFTIVDGTVYTLDFSGTKIGTGVATGSSSTADSLSLAWAQGVLLIGDAGGATSLLADGATMPVSGPPSNVLRVNTDGSSFGFKQTTGPNFSVWRTDTSLQGASCVGRAAREGVAISGQRVAWVEGISGAWNLEFADVTTTCSLDAIPIGSASFNVQAVGIAAGRAVVSTGYMPGTPNQIELALFDLATKAEVGSRLKNASFDNGAVLEVVIGAPKYALLVGRGTSAGRPLLVAL